ncbi:unnamed protein product, partial [Symbiodinium pilosum]
AAVTKTRCQPHRGATGSSGFSRPWSRGVESSPHAKPAPCSKCHQHARGPPHVNVNANAIASRSSSSSSTTCPDDSRGIPQSKPDKHSDFNGRSCSDTGLLSCWILPRLGSHVLDSRGAG